MPLPAAILAMAISLALGGISRRLGGILGMVDQPGAEGLKVHTTPAVPLGGVGILVGVLAGLAIAGHRHIGLFIASIAIWIVGLLDDFAGLSPRARLLGATAAGIVLVAYGIVPVGLGAVLFAILVVVLSINAVNLLDGLDALAGSVSVTALAGLAALAYFQDAGDPQGIVIAAAAVLGFLFWNLPPARLFLGNNGAYLVGLVIAWAALQQTSDGWDGVVAVAAVGVPFIDLGITIVRRIRAGAALFGGDRDHTYDRLHQSGWSVGRVAIAFSVTQALWSILVVTTAVALGEIAAALAALILGLIIVVAIGLRPPARLTPPG